MFDLQYGLYNVGPRVEINQNGTIAIIIGKSSELFTGFIVYENLKEKYPVIFNNKTTSVHIRRGDYLNYPNFHPTQSQEYYYNCIEKLSSDTDFFIFFSDDTTWCKNHFKEKNFLFIENEKDYLSLLLMSFCSNNIISNSSFSWWGAWLNKNNYKQVIGPKIWFGPGLNHNTSDIIPENWIKI